MRGADVGFEGGLFHGKKVPKFANAKGNLESQLIGC
jgi:hypothetical protein